MFNQNDDEDLFPSIGSSHLTNLFGGGSTQQSTDLKYTAPRQPRLMELIPKEKPPKIEPKVSVLNAKVVVASKLVNGEFVKVGKFGLAILGANEMIKEFLLYKDKQNVLAKATVNESFKLIEEESGFKFIDDLKTTWLVQFNQEDYEGFMNDVINKVAIIKNEKKVNIPEKVLNDTQDSYKADILSRMAKMGQSVLPGTKLDGEYKVNDLSKNIESAQLDHKGMENKILDNKVLENKHLEKNFGSIQNRTLENRNVSFENNQPIQSILPYTNQFQTYQLPNQEFNILMSENRTHNSEIRINLTTISTKLDTVLNEISKLKITPNTDRLENEFLKAKIFDLEEQLKTYPSKIANYENLIKINKELEEKSSNLEMTQKEIEELKGKLKESNEKIKNLEEENVSKNEELNKILDKNSDEIADKIEVSDKIKEIMNEMFQSVLSEFNESEPIGYKQLKNSLSKHLKQATFNIIDSLK